MTYQMLNINGVLDRALVSCADSTLIPEINWTQCGAQSRKLHGYVFCNFGFTHMTWGLDGVAAPIHDFRLYGYELSDFNLVLRSSR